MYPVVIGNYPGSFEIVRWASRRPEFMNACENSSVNVAYHRLAPSREWLNARTPILLTFDDGPDPEVTPRILDALRARRISSIFFVVGQCLDRGKNADIICRAEAEGHVIGNHTFSHSNLAGLTEERVREEIGRAESAICSFVRGSRLIRPPFGKVNPIVLSIFRQLRYTPMFWNVDARDWLPSLQPLSWVDRVCGEGQRSSDRIILAHDVHRTTADGLPLLLNRLSGEGEFPPFFGAGSAAPDVGTQPWATAVDFNKAWRTEHYRHGP